MYFNFYIIYFFADISSYELCAWNATEFCCPKDKFYFRPESLSLDISQNTICWDAWHESLNASHFAIHNAYGYFHSLRVQQLTKVKGNYYYDTL